MALVVFIAKECQEDAEKHGLGSGLNNLKESVEQCQNLTGFAFFPPTPFVKKQIGRRFRLLGYRFPVGDDELVVFLRLLGRGSGEYEDFLKNWDKDQDRILRQLQPYSHAELQRIFHEKTRTSPPPSRPEPTAEERAWLYEVLRHNLAEDELLVLETEAWVKRMRSPENRDFIALYHQLIEQLGISQLKAGSSNSDLEVHWEEKKRIGLIYLYRPDLQRLLLIEPLRSSDDPNGLALQHRRQLTNVGQSQHDLARIAARSYPHFMVLDQDAWLAIQKDQEANLALSPEEAELLESVRKAGVDGELGYPLFINGRAGSGKSTMLQYLAAEYIDFALRKNAKPLPLYLTCSRDLLERARETVRGLLTAHHRSLLEGAHNPTNVDLLLNKSFAVFHEFLYSLLPEDVQKALPRDRYVSYGEFRRLWANDFGRRPEARHFSADIAWHTIRSYIKGIRSSIGDELAPEEFKALPRRRRSVSEETYERIYDRVWTSWYKNLCDDGQYWDDQDLAAHVLQLGLAQRVDYSGIFCDEAQDFTPAELDIIFQLSVFGRRSLQPEELRRVPIVFAGDPLQTINPTGFRWDAVQADFHERFFAVLDPRRRSSIEISYRELRFNYRSNPGIVRFCNLIQLLRAALLGSTDMAPQEAWWIDAPVQPVWFANDNTQTKSELEKRVDLVKLVNCEEGEETDFVRSDPILKNLKEETEGIYRNVLGPTRAKGLEFPAVVLYRYGESAPANFARLLNGEIDVQMPEEGLPHEYFLNRLYVAASRAKGQLVVVDSNKALENFWRFATDPELIDHLIEKAGGSGVWKNAITFLVSGREQAWSGESVDPKEQAIEYATQGRRKRDPYLMRQAALAYRGAGDELEAGKSLALAAEYEGKLGEAGNKYREIGLYEDAYRCYWEGRRWSALCELAAREPSFASRLESQAADFMARAANPLPGLLDGIIHAAANPARRDELSHDSTWAEVLSRVAERLSTAITDKSLPWPNLHAAFNSLSSAGIRINDPHLAAIAFAANDYRKAAELWERAGGQEREEYRRAKAHIEPFPRNLEWFMSLKETKQVLAQWREHQHQLPELSALDSRIAATVMDSALAEGELNLAKSLLEARPDKERAVRLVAAAANAGEPKLASEAAVLTAKLLVQAREWKAAVQFAEDMRLPGHKEDQTRRIRSVLGTSAGVTEVFRAIVEEFAASDDLAGAGVEHQQLVADFLNRHFVAESRGRQPRSIPVQTVGAAIERAGRIVDALQYYEGIARQPTSGEQQRFAVERMVHSLEQYADYLRSRGDERQARQRQSRAQQLRERSQLVGVKLPKYPVVQTSPLHEGSSEWTRGPIRIVLSRSHGRVRIEHAERFETVTLNWKEAALLGDAKFARIDIADGESAAWTIDGWDATIRLKSRDDGMQLIARFGKEPFEVSLE